jgi:aspartyl protease
MNASASWLCCVVAFCGVAGVASAQQTAAPSSADAAFAAGDFERAAREYAVILSTKPDDAAANAGLGAVDLYRNDLVGAERHLRAATAADAANARARRLLDEVARRRGGDGTYRVEPYGGEAQIPFVATDPLPVLAVRVGGTHDALFFVDTGAPGIVLDPDFAKEIGVPMRAAGEGVFAGGQRAPIMKGELDKIALGPVTVDRVPVTLLPTRGFGLLPGKRLDGIIGTAFLYNFLSTIDYVHGRLVLRPRSASAQFEQHAKDSAASVVPMWLVGDHFVFARGRLNDAPPGLFNVDTGLAGGGVQATKQAIDAAKIVLDEAHASQGMGGGGVVRTIPFTASVTVGERRVDNVDGIYTPDGSQYGIFPFAVIGTVSHGYFRQCTLTLDFDAMRLVMAGA